MDEITSQVPSGAIDGSDREDPFGCRYPEPPSNRDEELAADGVGATSDGEPPFNGRIVADEMEARALQAWLTGRGLEAEIELLRWMSTSGPIAAPGLAVYIDRLGRSCIEACVFADKAGDLWDQDLDTAAHDAMFDALERSIDAVSDAQMWTRRLAQLSLGVGAQVSWCHEVERADRAAAIALIRPVRYAEEQTSDSVTFTARRFAEFATELAGVLRRMIIGHPCTPTFRRSDGGPAFRLSCGVDLADNVTLVLAEFGLGSDERLVQIGWTPSHGQFIKQWDDPVDVVEPVRLTVETLRDILGVESPDQLAVTTGAVGLPVK